MKRKLLNEQHLEAWSLDTETGRVIRVSYNTTRFDADSAIAVANRLIPHGWKPAHSRPTLAEFGKIELPIRRAIRGLGR